MPWLPMAGLGLVLVGTCGFLALLFFLDLPPKAAIFRLSSRLGVNLDRWKPAVGSAPYRQIAPLTEGLQRPSLLNLETSDGSGQAVHPDVAYIAEGFGEGRWNYWMACTPYPNGDPFYENPELFASYDGIHWTVPTGLKNPLVPSLKTPGDHNSDPDILFHKDELWLFFRETRNSKTPCENRIYMMKSSDGVRWSAPAEALRDGTGRMLLSPAVIHDGRRFVMWTIDVVGGVLALVRRHSDEGLSWSEPAPATLAGLRPGRFVWHIDVIQENESFSLSAVVVSCSGAGGAGAEIHYASSRDDGMTWMVEDLLLGRNYEFESGFHYRATLYRRTFPQCHYDLWYTAADAKRVFSIAHVRMVREGNKLVPATFSHLAPGPLRVFQNDPATK